jgi:predicted nucleic-acid-binding protein
MRAADTNLLVRLMVGDDLAQTTAAEAFIEKGVWVSHLALAEAVWVLSKRYLFTPSKLVEVIELFLANVDVTLQDADVVAAALEHFRNKPALGFSDCLMLEIARKAGHLPLGTFDRKLARLPGAERVA